VSCLSVTFTEYKLFAFEDLDPNLVYDPDLIGRFPNRDLIDTEVMAGGGGDSRTQGQQTQQLGGLRSVNSSSNACTSNLICVIRTIAADETRELNLGR